LEEQIPRPYPITPTNYVNIIKDNAGVVQQEETRIILWINRRIAAEIVLF